MQGCAWHRGDLGLRGGWLPRGAALKRATQLPPQVHGLSAALLLCLPVLPVSWPTLSQRQMGASNSLECKNPSRRKTHYQLS